MMSVQGKWGTKNEEFEGCHPYDRIPYPHWRE